MKLFQLFANRTFMVILMLAIQVFSLVFMIFLFQRFFIWFYIFCVFISMICAFLVINDSYSNPGYKIAWLIPILLFPIFGGLFYMLFGGNRLTKKEKTQLRLIGIKLSAALQEDRVKADGMIRDREAAVQSAYITRTTHSPVYQNTYTQYLSPGECKFACLKEELLKAQEYIFLEYFIIERGVMWDSILEILLQKVKEGVDVRVIYDDIGSLFTLPYGYDKVLEQMGIQCRVFNPFVPILSARHNNRDHRKIVVIDGKVGFTGGINLADEYINVREKHGYWKDASIMLKGEAVYSLTVMFLSLWNQICDTDEDFEMFRPPIENVQDLDDGFVQPFTDSPLDTEAVGENVYLNLINRAKNYVYINTPYLILNNEMITALCIAVKSGVDVRIVTPHVPDKWFVHAVTRSNYDRLVEAGVKIYEYTPGFMHAKTFVVDDKYAVVGSINLDYRSLYLHFECGVWLYKTRSIYAVKEDFLRTLEVCRQITWADCRAVHWLTRLGRSILNIFAPLM